MTKEKRPLKLKNDYVFKAVFGADQEESKYMLILLLNLVLEREENPITEITLKNPYIVDQNIDLHGSILDIYAVTDGGERIDVEMQMSYSRSFLKRTSSYISKIVNEQLEHGDSYDKIKPVIGIYFVDDVIFPDIEDYHTIFTWREKTRGNHLADYLADLQPIQEMHYIQLGRMNKESMESMSELEKICCYLRYEGEPESEEWIDTLAEKEEKGLIGMIKKKLDTIRQDDRAYYDAISREKFLFDQREQKRTIAEQDKKIETQGKALLEKDKTIKTQGKALLEKDETIKTQGKALLEKDKTIENQGKALEEKDRENEELRRRIRELEGK